MADRLAEILRTKQDEVARLQPHAAELRRQALLRNDFRGMQIALARGDEIGLIAEIKKASPSAGIIAADFNPINQAREYARGGAHALSVLTDETFFQGKLHYLRDVRQQVELPLLRKDFIINDLQVYESVVAGADAILLIVAALSDDDLLRLHDLARTLQLEVLVEVHNMEEMDRALEIGPTMVGINNRNLRTFEVDLAVTEELVDEIPAECVAVSESGIRTGEDVRRLRRAGANAILVGETLMRAQNLQAKMVELLLKDEE
ncbi:indole-3-glycerol phosphate synthase TrpC [Verrucomicrobia bacterium LW23]|nr:indole-3-glycerol phosphate synthase TrpC [Verrucomicrobia bacterium LW23]